MILMGDAQIQQPCLHSRHSVSKERLLPHLSSLSDLDQDPRSLLKFCTNRIIYKNSFSIECIHAHIDVYTCRQNTYVNNMKYGQFHSI